MALPKQVRDELMLNPGDTLDLVSDDGEGIPRPSRATARLWKHRGGWVFSSGAPITLAETNQVTNAMRSGGRAVGGA